MHETVNVVHDPGTQSRYLSVGLIPGGLMSVLVLLLSVFLCSAGAKSAAPVPAKSEAPTKVSSGWDNQGNN